MATPTAPKLRTFLWYKGNLGEALAQYQAIFGENLQIHSSGSPDAAGKIWNAEFSIFGHELVGMGYPGGNTFNNSISLALTVDGQEEIDRLWEALTKDGGKAGQCGWCTDAFGVSWQVIPVEFSSLLGSSDLEQQAYAHRAMRAMSKIVIRDLIKP